jgi:hypothetical protein
MNVGTPIRCRDRELDPVLCHVHDRAGIEGQDGLLFTDMPDIFYALLKVPDRGMAVRIEHVADLFGGRDRAGAADPKPDVIVDQVR